MSRVLVLTRYDRLGASSRVRFLQFLPELERHGLEFDVVPLLDAAYLTALYRGEPINLFAVFRSYLRRMWLLLRRRRYDLIWLEKEALPWLPTWIESRLLRGVPYIVDFDDAWYLRYERHRLPFVRFLLGSKIDAIMRAAAVVVVGNDYLAEHARRSGARRIELVPTVIDLQRYPEAGAGRQTDERRPVSIGWIGTPITAAYLNQIEPAFRELPAGTGQLRVVGAGVPQAFTGLSATGVGWSEASEVAEICNFDIGVMPLADESWEQGKCAYKLLQIMAAGKPVIASPVGANREVVRHGVNGLLAKSKDEWVVALRRLIVDPALRERMGAAARHTVEAGYSVEGTTPRLASILLETIGKSQLQVLIVLRQLEIGGTEKHVVRVVPELRRRGIDVSLFTLRRGGKLDAAVAAMGIPTFGGPVTAGKTYKRIQGAWQLARHLSRHRPDIVHFFLPEPYLIGSVVAATMGIKVRVMSRRSLANYQRRHPFLAVFERHLHRYTVALLGNSKAVVDELIREAGTRAKIGLIYNGIEIPPAIDTARRAACRRDLALPDDGFVMTIVANLIEYKGHEDLLRALALVRDRLPVGWRLMAVGRDDGAGEALRQMTAAFGLADHVRWVGERDDVDTFLGATDVVLLCSHEEGFSNSLIEAMAWGLPVIATAVGGNVEAVVPGDTGLLVPVRAPADLAAAIMELAANPERRAQLGAAGRRRVVDQFSIDACVQRYVNMYRGIAKIDRVAAQTIIDAPAAAG